MNSDLFLLAIVAASQTVSGQDAPPEQPSSAEAPTVGVTTVPENGSDAVAAGDAQASAPPTEPAPQEPDAEEEEEIVVTGTRARGTVDTDIPAEVTLDRRDIRAYGASNIGELLEALAPQTSSGRGRDGGSPVVLLNGRRISGFREIRNIPPEAITRVEVFPEEVALRYGYRADQRVVNFVLRRRFRAITAELEAGAATEGGRPSHEADINVLQLNDNGRWTVDAEYSKQSPLFESERDIIQATTGTGDPAVPSLSPYRTLLGETESWEMAATLNRTILENVSATLNTSLDINSSESRFGLPSITLDVPANSPFAQPGADTVFRYLPTAGPLRRLNDSRAFHTGVALNGDVDRWRWSFTGNYDRNTSDNVTNQGILPTLIQDRILANDPDVDPRGDLNDSLFLARPSDRTHSLTNIGSAEAVASGPLFLLPGGEINASLRVGFDTRDLESESLRSGIVTTRDLSRDRAHGQANIDIPIASRREGFLEAIGNLSLNANAEVEHFSDFGTLRTLGAGLNWSPIEMVSLIASMTDEEGPPSISQLGDPVLLTPNVRVFDFVRGETVDISRLEGGNPQLVADNRRVYKLGATVRPFTGQKDLTVSANYTDTRIDNPIASFPTATAEIEAAFPDRFVRDADGRLLRIDARPLNFVRSKRRELRWGLNLSLPFGPQPQPRQGRRGGRDGGPPAAPGTASAPSAPATGGAPPQGRPEGGPPQNAGQGPGGGRGPGGRGGFGGGRGGFGGGPGGGRIQLGLFHTWRFEDSVLIRPGVPELDFLNGSAAGNRGGTARHQIDLDAGIFRNGFGARINGSWQSGTNVLGGPVSGGGTRSDLAFSDLATINLRLFADLSQQRSLVRKVPFFRGTRVSLSVDNVFNSRPRVTDASGTTPLSYQPDYLDPLGRSVRLSLRKLFF